MLEGDRFPDHFSVFCLNLSQSRNGSCSQSQYFTFVWFEYNYNNNNNNFINFFFWNSGSMTVRGKLICSIDDRPLREGHGNIKDLQFILRDTSTSVMRFVLISHWIIDFTTLTQSQGIIKNIRNQLLGSTNDHLSDGSRLINHLTNTVTWLVSERRWFL